MNTEMENGTQMTLEECVPMISQKQTVGALDSHVSPKELIFLQSEDISQLNKLLLEIESLLTKEDGEKSHRQCNEIMPEFGILTDSESYQQEPQQNIRIMSLDQILQWNLGKSNNSMVVGIPQWFCLMKNPMNTAKKCGVRYVRQLEGNPDAERICDEICQKIYDLRISVSEKK